MERKFTRGLNKPGMAAQLRESVSQVVRESAVLVRFVIVQVLPLHFSFSLPAERERERVFGKRLSLFLSLSLLLLLLVRLHLHLFLDSFLRVYFDIIVTLGVAVWACPLAWE